MSVLPRDFLYHEEPGITLYCGDCREILPMLPMGDVIVTDPPYGFGAYATDLETLTAEMLREWTARYNSTAVFGYPERLVGLCVAAGLAPDEWVTWWPTNKWGGRGEALPRASEHIAIFGATPGAKHLMRPRSLNAHGALRSQERGLSAETAREGDVWRDAAPGVQFNYHLRLHPNEKPQSVMIRLVTLCTAEGWTVVDPFMGSGTTLVAAKSLGRRAIGIEIEERYCEIAVKRLRQGVLL